MANNLIYLKQWFNISVKRSNLALHVIRNELDRSREKVRENRASGDDYDSIRIILPALLYEHITLLENNLRHLLSIPELPQSTLLYLKLIGSQTDVVSHPRKKVVKLTKRVHLAEILLAFPS